MGNIYCEEPREHIRWRTGHLPTTLLHPAHASPHHPGLSADVQTFSAALGGTVGPEELSTEIVLLTKRLLLSKR